MFKYTIRWKDCDKSPSTVGFIEDKLTQLETFSFLNENVKFEIVYYEKTKTFKVRLLLDVKNTSKPIRAEGQAQDILKAINLTFDKAIDQIRRVKTKMYRN